MTIFGNCLQKLFVVAALFLAFSATNSKAAPVGFAEVTANSNTVSQTDPSFALAQNGASTAVFDLTTGEFAAETTAVFGTGGSATAGIQSANPLEFTNNGGTFFVNIALNIEGTYNLATGSGSSSGLVDGFVQTTVLGSGPNTGTNSARLVHRVTTTGENTVTETLTGTQSSTSVKTQSFSAFDANLLILGVRVDPGNTLRFWGDFSALAGTTVMGQTTQTLFGNTASFGLNFSAGADFSTNFLGPNEPLPSWISIDTNGGPPAAIPLPAGLPMVLTALICLACLRRKDVARAMS